MSWRPAVWRPIVRVLVNVTSDKCYLNKGKAAPYRECDRLGGFDPYSSSKACAETGFPGLWTFVFH